jgi:tripartite-type tricarboxylate transporter receptor subunit TctC
MIRTLRIMGIIGILFAFVCSGWAAEYPTKAIIIINPYAPGGTLDLQSRAFAAVAEKIIGQPLVVMNKPGATGMLGGLLGAQAAPDGYTLTVASTAMTAALEWEAANGRKTTFTRKDFVTIGSFTMSPPIIATYYDSPWKTLADFIKDARAKPGFYSFSSSGPFGMSHLPAEAFAGPLGLKFRHVPTAGGGPALTATVGKHVDFCTQYPPTTLPLIAGKKLRGLAVQGDRRLKGAPDIPSVKELGIDAEYYAWVGIAAPKNTPPAIVAKLRDVIGKAVQEQRFIDAIEKPGDEVRFMNGEELEKFWDKESEMTLKIQKRLAKESSLSPTK